MARPKPERSKIVVPIYFPPDLHEWLQNLKRATGTPVTQLVERFCDEARLRAELQAAADTVEPSPDALDAIIERIERRARGGQ